MIEHYYNDVDPFCCAWLRELIADRLIPPGDVDNRSILEVKPNELRRYTQLHFFAGIAGWPLALRIAGISPERRLASASCPCQPLSVAGLRKGDADERHLWPVVYDLLAELEIAELVGEQVGSSDGYEWLAGVRADLEAARYAVGCADLPAAGAGAPHIRQRLFWYARRLADANGERRGIDGRSGLLDGERSPLRNDADGRGQDDGLADTGRERDEHDGRDVADATRNSEGEAQQRERLRDDARNGEPVGSRLADTDGRITSHGDLQRSGEHGQQPQDSGIGEWVAHAERHAGEPWRPTDEPGSSPSAPDTRSRAQSGRRSDVRDGLEHAPSRGRGIIGDASQSRRSGHPDSTEPDGEQRMGEPIRSGLEGFAGHGANRDKSRWLDALEGRSAWASSAFIPCADGKQRRVPTNEEGIVEPLLFPLAAAGTVGNRMGTLRGAGNSINVYVAARFAKTAFEITGDLT